MAANLRLQRYGRPHRADLVAGPGHAVGLRPRRGRDRQQLVPDDRDRPRRQRLRDGPARVQLTPERDALFTVYSPILVHLPGTPAGTLSPLLDSIVQEVDIRTGLVVWEWHAYGHIPLADSTRRPPTAPPTTPSTSTRSRRCRGGRVLASARDTSAIYEIERAGGRIVWTLGGKASSFRLGHGARFWLPARRADAAERGPQHVRRRGRPAAEGAVLARAGAQARPAPPARHAGERSTAAPRTPPPRARAACRRSPNGNVFVGFGAEPFFSEFSRSGRLAVRRERCRRTTAATASTASPGRRRRRRCPTLAATRSGPASVSVYASWNGATDVARWQLLAGPAGGTLAAASSAARQRLRDAHRLQRHGDGLRRAGTRLEGARAGDLGSGDGPVSDLPGIGEVIARRAAAPGRGRRVADRLARARWARPRAGAGSAAAAASSSTSPSTIPEALSRCSTWPSGCAIRDVRMVLRPVVERGISGDPAAELKRSYAVDDARRLAGRIRALRCSEPSRATPPRPPTSPSGSRRRRRARRSPASASRP